MCVYDEWMKCVLYSFARRAPCRLYCGGLVMTHDVIFYYFLFFTVEGYYYQVVHCLRVYFYFKAQICICKCVRT